MEKYCGALLGRLALRFGADSAYVPSDLSAAALSPSGALVVAADELATINWLSADRAAHVYSQQRCDKLNKALGLEQDDEVDIEGLSFDPQEDALFLVGSHSAKRKKPKGQGSAKGLERLAEVDVDPSRFVLARLAQPEKKKHSTKRIASLPMEGEESLLSVLSGDAHLGPFLADKSAKRVVPGKDNGFDIEGLAVDRERLLIGLRGPVLRGWAFILELALSEPQPGVLQLSGGRKHRYFKHALNLHGLGIRELLVHGDDLLIMAGPTMALDGVHRLYRLRGGLKLGRDTLNEQEPKRLEPLFEVPFVHGYDRAEGLTLYSWFDEHDSVLVVHDSPSPARRLNKTDVLADVFAL